MDIITGVQGTGKSYKAVYDIYTNQKKYYKIYTDVDGFKEDKIENVEIKPFSKWRDILKYCHNAIVNQEKSWDYVNSILEKKGIIKKGEKTLLVIDEAQNHFKKRTDEELLFLVTQHRHMYIDLVLITQSLTLIGSDYRIINNYFLAKPPSRQLIPGKIIYHHYTDIEKSKEGEAKNLILKKDQNIFNLYTSGDSVAKQNLFKKLILPSIFVVSVLFVAYYSYSNSIFSSSKKNEIQPTSVSSIPPTVSSTSPQKISKKEKKTERKALFQRDFDSIYVKSISSLDNCMFDTTNFYILTEQNNIKYNHTYRNKYQERAIITYTGKIIGETCVNLVDKKEKKDGITLSNT